MNSAIAWNNHYRIRMFIEPIKLFSLYQGAYFSGSLRSPVPDTIPLLQKNEHKRYFNFYFRTLFMCS